MDRVDARAEGSPPGIRTEVVRPPSSRRETVLVLKAAFHVAYWSAFVILGRGGPTSANAADMPFERRFEDLDSADQRVFRSIREGIAEAEAQRSRSGRWPTTAALAQSGVPPFAPDPIDRAGYTWRLLAKGTLANYVGTPSPESGRRAFVVILTEPDPGAAPDPQTQPDEIHHRLDSGMMIHVTVWMGPSMDESREPVPSVNPDDGWQRIAIGAATVPAK